MSYTMKKVSFDEAKSMIKDYTMALVYNISNLQYIEVEKLDGIDWDECLEARFFSDKEELHVYKDSGNFICVLVCDDIEDAVSYRSYELSNQFKGDQRNSFSVKEYLGYDEDGQVYVEATRLTVMAV